MKKIPITKTVFDEEDLAIIQEPLKNGWVVQGPFVKEFEEKFAQFAGAKHAVACTSCTTGMHLATAAIGLQPGDEAIVPGFTWIATANVVEYQGATVKFCDVDLDTFNLDVKKLERLITPKTKAILPVHLFGLSADMDPIMALAKEHGLTVIEDAACGFGSRYKDQHVGTIGHFGAFSLHPRKAITTGEGGMVLANDDAMVTKIRSLRDHGAAASDFTRHHGKAAFLLSSFPNLGFNYRMTDIQGALGVSQMRKAQGILDKRRERAAIYRRELADVADLVMPAEPTNYLHSYQSFVCLYRPETPSLANVEKLNDRRNKLMMGLEEIGIATRQGTHAVINLEYYKNRYKLTPEQFPNSHMSELLSLSLPLYAQMTDDEQQYVIDNLKKMIATV